jgi:hypothetical protein
MSALTTRVRSWLRNAQMSQLCAGHERLCQGVIAAPNGGYKCGCNPLVDHAV